MANIITKSNFPKSNKEITTNTVRLINENGDMLGVVSLSEAMQLSYAAGLDLVEISPNAEPPVCRILDFGKYKYEIKKKSQDAKKKQKIVNIKEVKVRPNIGQGDYDVKMNNLKKFIINGDKVKVSLRFKGRESTHSELGMKIFERIKEDTIDLAKVEFGPRMEGNKSILMILVAK